MFCVEVGLHKASTQIPANKQVLNCRFLETTAHSFMTVIYEAGKGFRIPLYATDVGILT